MVTDNPEAFKAYVDHEGVNGEDAVSDFEEAFCGEYGSGADYAQELYEEIADAHDHTRLSTWPFNCIDWERAWGELDMGGDNFAVATGRGSVFVFRSV